MYTPSTNLAAPAAAVVSGAWLVARDDAVVGAALGVLGLLAWTLAARPESE